MMGFIGEIRYGYRSMMRQRSYTAVAALTLAIGIAANTAIVSMANAIVYRPYSFPDLDRIVSLSETIPKVSDMLYGVSPGNYFDWKERNTVFEETAAYQGWDVVLTGHNEPQQVQGFLVSPTFFGLLRIAPLKGRTFAGDFSDRYAVVVSYGFWQGRLAGTPGVIGKQVVLNGMGYTVIGVMPPELDYPMYAQIWGPWIVTPGEARQQRENRELAVIARLKPGVPLPEARANLQAISTLLEREYPIENAGRGIDVRLLRDSIDPYANRYMAVVTMAVGFLLLLACANVANLQLARGTSRRREIALRITLGAGRARIVRQLLLEGTLLSSLGAVLGLPLAVWTLTAIKVRIPGMVAAHLPGLRYARVDSTMLLYNLLAALLTGILFTLPALFQISSTRLVDTLKEGSRGTTNAGGRALRSGLVVAEIGLALVLLVAAAVMAKAVGNLSTISRGFRSDGVATFAVRLTEDKYPSDSSVGILFKELLRRLRELPQVESASVVSQLPALGQNRASVIRVEGQPAQSTDKPRLAEVRVVSEDYFRTLQIPLVDGRPVARQDTGTSLPVAVVSKSAAQRLWPNGRAIGQRIRLDSAGMKTPWLTVVGVGGDVNHFYLDTQIRPTIYVPYLQLPARQLKVLVRTKAPFEQTVAGVREAVRSVDAGLPVELERVNRYFDDLTGGIGIVANLITALAGIALILAAAGVYATMAYSVAQRTHEIAIRMALGALPGDVSRMVVGEAIRLVAAALLLGLPGALLLCRVMSSALAGVITLSAVTVGVSVALLVVVALLASYLPARRTARVDPLSALRCS